MDLVKIKDITSKQLASICDHTFLEPLDSEDREHTLNIFLEKTCQMNYRPYGICVYPVDIPEVKRYLGQNDLSEIILSSVVGFPNGAKDGTKEKMYQAVCALQRGAREIDMVINPYHLLKKRERIVGGQEIGKVADITHSYGGILKVILENSIFNSDPELIKLGCQICDDCGADFVKTSTGFGEYGAHPEDLRVMRMNFSGGIKISGGVNKENVYNLLESASGRLDGRIDLGPSKIRIGESSLLDGF